jgi:hypothetical protein
LGFAVICPASQSTPAAAQNSQVDQVDIAYVEPSNDDLKPIYDRLKKRHVLEQLKIFLSPLELPRRLLVKADQCGDAITLPYQRGGPVTICYEYVRRIEQYAPSEPNILVGPGALTGENKGMLRKDDLLVGPVVMLVLHEVALAMFDLLDVPVWGNEDEAANRLAGFMMTQFSQEVAWKTLMGAAWYVSQTAITGVGIDFYYVRSSDAHRFYNILCMAYASDPKTFAFLAKNFDIPSNRIEWCARDFEQVQYAFDETILPHLDQILLKKVQAMPWLPPAKPQ